MEVPKRIYLQIEDNDIKLATWSEEQINDNDIEYIKKEKTDLKKCCLNCKYIACNIKKHFKYNMQLIGNRLFRESDFYCDEFKEK